MKNLHTADSPSAVMSPGWAIGWYCIPIANLWKPAEGMSQIYHGSHESIGLKTRNASPIPAWWICWLVMSVPSAIADAVVGTSDSGLDPLSLGLYGLSAGLGIAAATLFLRMARSVTNAQEQFGQGGVAKVFE